MYEKISLELRKRFKSKNEADRKKIFAVFDKKYIEKRIEKSFGRFYKDRHQSDKEEFWENFDVSPIISVKIIEINAEKYDMDNFISFRIQTETEFQTPAFYYEDLSKFHDYIDGRIQHLKEKTKNFKANISYKKELLIEELKFLERINKDVKYFPLGNSSDIYDILPYFDICHRKYRRELYTKFISICNKIKFTNIIIKESGKQEIVDIIIMPEETELTAIEKTMNYHRAIFPEHQINIITNFNKELMENRFQSNLHYEQLDFDDLQLISIY